MYTTIAVTACHEIRNLIMLDNNNFLCRAEMQVAVTRDYCTNSWFFSVITGAMNFQTAHHLFPGIIIHFKFLQLWLKTNFSKYSINFCNLYDCGNGP